MYANSPALAEERAYWNDVERIPALTIPPDFDAAGNRYGDAVTLRAELDATETEALLTRAHRAYDTQINDLLLTALARAAQACCSMDRMRVLLEGHGREEIAAGIDITRTVGWFTTIYPVALDISGAATVAESIPRIRAGLRRIPNKGIGYGILRYLAPGAMRDSSVCPSSASTTWASFTNGSTTISRSPASPWGTLAATIWNVANPWSSKPSLPEDGCRFRLRTTSAGTAARRSNGSSIAICPSCAP